MLILPPGHHRDTSPSRRLTKRERRLAAVMAVVAVALTIGTLVSLGAKGRSTGHGCVYAVIAGPVGAGDVYRCGQDAKTLCATLGTPAGFTGAAAQAIAVECRKAKLRVGP